LEDRSISSPSERTIYVVERVCELDDGELEQLNKILKDIADVRYRPEKELLRG